MSQVVDKYQGEGVAFVTGVQALVRLALEQRITDERAGLDTGMLISGYPGSPLAGLDLELGRNAALLREHGIVHQPALNEEIAATALLGSQVAHTLPGARHEGIVGFWYGKSPGVDRASDALRHANLIGTHPRGGAVAFVGDDPAAKSSTVPARRSSCSPTSACRCSTRLTRRTSSTWAGTRSRCRGPAGLWVALKIVATVADGVGLVEADVGRVTVAADHGRPFAHQPNARILQPALSEMERSREGIRAARSPWPTRAPTAQPGAAFRATTPDRHRGGRQDLPTSCARRCGSSAWTMPTKRARDAAAAPGHDPSADPGRSRSSPSAWTRSSSWRRSAVRRVGRQGDPLRPTGRAPRHRQARPRTANRCSPLEGELDADLIARGLAARLGGPPIADGGTWRGSRTGPAVTQLPVVARTPYFCSGCPHNTSTKAPDGSLVGGGIGCHAMVLMMRTGRGRQVVGLTQMGGEGAQWIGHGAVHRHASTSAEHRRRHLPPLGQPGRARGDRRGVTSPTSCCTTRGRDDRRAAGGRRDGGPRADPGAARRGGAASSSPPTSPEPVPAARSGAGTAGWRPSRSGPATGWPRRSRSSPLMHGVTVLIHDQECATELRRKRKRGKLARAPAARVINERVCEGCGDCGAEVELPVRAAGRDRVRAQDPRPRSTSRHATRTTPA
jgi:indolepyruvate ferredoxin oxidoreductase